MVQGLRLAWTAGATANLSAMVRELRLARTRSDGGRNHGIELDRQAIPALPHNNPTPYADSETNNLTNIDTQEAGTKNNGKFVEKTKTEHTKKADKEIEDIIDILEDIDRILKEDTDTTKKQAHSQQDQDMKSKEATNTALEHAFPGAAGRTRSDDLSPQRRPKRHKTARKRNTKRGIRSIESIQRRKETRTSKRRAARQAHRRKEYKNSWLEHYKQNICKHQAKAKKPQIKIVLGRKFKMATLNTRSLKKPGMREEIEKWMKDNGIMVLALQETRIEQNQKEARGAYTWYMSGETKQKEIEKYTAGVGLVIDNNFAKYVEDVIPHTDRIIQLKLKGTCNINIFSIYLPPATTTKSQEKNWTQFKEDVYQRLEKIINKTKGRGPMYIMGDWNARMQKAQNKTERKVMGKWTLEPEKAKVQDLMKM